MILQKEIATIAEQQKVPKSTVDKDWALGHFVAAIYSIPELMEMLVFKGGTCLKKCWFNAYRFSEDLDFTSLSPDFRFTRNHLDSICLHVNQQSGILTHIVSLRNLKSKEKHTGFEAVIKFWGADHSRKENPPSTDRWLTSIKIEIILFELMAFPPTHRSVYHIYSDRLPLIANSIPCYSIEEIISEKLRAIIQRSYSAPRDFFDLWYISCNYPDADFDLVVKAFHNKMKYKGLTFSGVDQLLNDGNSRIVETAWKNSLIHQLPPDLMVDFETVRNDLLKLFARLF